MMDNKVHGNNWENSDPNTWETKNQTKPPPKPAKKRTKRSSISRSRQKSHLLFYQLVYAMEQDVATNSAPPY